MAIFLIPPKEFIFTNETQPLPLWPIRSVDTMKYSRDLSREKMNDPKFDEIIDRQVRDIAAIGANYVAIGTPYDKEFIPMLIRWVSAARKYNLKVWFRGNLSGWEKWFEYGDITREEHTKMIEEFIVDNPDLFQDGDIFSTCHECENGGPGYPGGDTAVAEYRKFIIQEYQTAKSAFEKIGKKVDANSFSMSGDAAKLIMDKKTTAALGGIITIDHYVKTPEKLLKDVKNLVAQSGGKIMLGEFGAPIPDINGKMTSDEQAQWIAEALGLLASSREVIGINYWTGVGGSTQIWSDKGIPFPAVEALKKFYAPNMAFGVIRDKSGNPIAKAKIMYSEWFVYSDREGYFELNFVPDDDLMFNISASGFLDQEMPLERNTGQLNIVLEKENIIIKLMEFIK